MKPVIHSAFLVLGATFCFLGADSARAQSIFLEPNNIPSVHLEALRPGFGGVNLTNFSFAFFLSGRIPVGEELQIRGDIPYMTYKMDDDSYSHYYYGYSSTPQSDNAFGNPYLGLDFGNLENGYHGELGVRLPVVKDSSGAEEAGILTDPVERMEAFAQEVLPVYLGVNYRYRSDNGFAMRLRLVPVIWFRVGDSSDEDTDIFALFSAQAWYENEKVGVGGGFSGRYLTTGDADDFGERTLHQFGFFANYSFGSVMPGFQVRFPLDSDLKDFADLVPSYSLSIGVKL